MSVDPSDVSASASASAPSAVSRRAGGLTAARLQAHDSASSDGGESADVFGDLGSNHLPWRRPSATNAAARLPGEHASTMPTFDDLTDMTKSVYSTYSAREQLLQSSYANTRWYMTESYLETELSRYELLLKDMRDNSVLKSVDEIDIKLAVPWDENVNIDDVRNRKVSDIKITWLLKTLKASEDFRLKSNLVRSMFRRTNAFFNELNDMEFNFLTKKHLRELSKQAMLQKLRGRRAPERSEASARVDTMEIAQQRELQSMEIRNLKELYVRMLQKEWGGLDHHLDMLETLYNSLHRVYIEIMNLKIRGVVEWHQFRQLQDKSLKDAIRHLHEQCASEFQLFKDNERIAELKAVKRTAEEDREKRRRIFGDSDVVLSSELVFGMTMTRNNRGLHVLDDTSSTGTFDMDSLDDEDRPDQDLSKNAEFLHLIKTRIQRKNSVESKYNEMIATEIAARRRAEVAHLDVTRRHERVYMKTAMEKYFALEKKLEDKIQEFLFYEKNAIDALRARQLSEIDSVVHSQEVGLARLKSDGAAAKAGAEEGERRRDDVMITAHVFHELRNVLASILCLAENMREDPSAAERIIEEQCDVCTYALETMSDMLSISRIKDPGFTLHPTDIKVSKLFDAVMRIQGPRVAKGIVLVKLMDDESMIVRTSEKLLLQLLINLLSNASKFTTRGTIALCARKVDDGRGVRIGVVDTGVGVHRGTKQKINSDSGHDGGVRGFMDTHSEVSSNMSEYKATGYTVRNTGYGLYLASAIATTLGGKLRVQCPVSAADDLPTHEGFPGSFFYTVLPPVPPKSSPKSSPPAATSPSSSPPAPPTQWAFRPSGPCSVLIVDDQKLLRQTMILMLKQLRERYPEWQLHIETACSAEEALRRHRQRHFDIITLDEYFDQVVLSRHVQQTPSQREAPRLVFNGTPAEDRQAYIDFKSSEAFHVTSSDGALVGSDIVGALRSTRPPPPLIVSCTGSEDITGCVLKKPYTCANFIALMEAHANDYVADGVLVPDAARGGGGEARLRKGDGLVIFTSRSAPGAPSAEPRVMPRPASNTSLGAVCS
jgi:signal transduction histidine kinase/CheY-like chemotaxis protein